MSEQHNGDTGKVTFVQHGFKKASTDTPTALTTPAPVTAATGEGEEADAEPEMVVDREDSQAVEKLGGTPFSLEDVSGQNKAFDPLAGFDADTDTHTTVRPSALGDLVGNPDAPTHRLIIGDNLPVLQSLVGEHAGTVDVIYIDPPYNTGKNFIYDDSRFISKAKKDPKYRHASWMEFMQPRLELAYQLLADDGAIFISIDDNEHAYLKVLMDGVFGPQNFVANIIWQKSNSTRNDASYFSVSHEYVMVYQKGGWERALLPRPDHINARYKHDDDDGRGPWAPTTISARTYSARTDYPITNPNTGAEFNPPNGRAWIYSKERFQELLDDNRIYWGAKGTSAPAEKKYLTDVQQGVVPTTWWTAQEVGTTSEGNKMLRSILGGRPFDYPKPVELVKAVLKLHQKKNAKVLDFFAGSGTTGQATAELNLEDGGERTAILVTNNEANIAENVTYPRLIKVLTGEGWADGKEHPATGQGLTVAEIVDADEDSAAA